MRPRRRDVGGKAKGLGAEKFNFHFRSEVAESLSQPKELNRVGEINQTRMIPVTVFTRNQRIHRKDLLMRVGDLSHARNVAGKIAIVEVVEHCTKVLRRAVHFRYNIPRTTTVPTLGKQDVPSDPKKAF